LGDETLINELRNSKITYEETSKRIDMSKRLSEEIDVSRDQYRILAQQLSRIYFVLLELPNLNNLYHYSLDWFLN
jgi:dynein heavy chain